MLDHRAGLELLRLSLRDMGSPWASLVDAVTATLPPLRGDERDAVRRLAAEGPPEEEVGLAPFASPQFSPGAASGAAPEPTLAAHAVVPGSPRMNEFLFVVVPYLCLTTFVVGHLWRYRYDKFGWTTRSSQLYENRLLRIGSPLFHFGMLGRRRRPRHRPARPAVVDRRGRHQRAHLPRGGRRGRAAGRA